MSDAAPEKTPLDLTDPAVMEAVLSELEDEIGNLGNLARDRARNHWALERGFLALISALEETMPAIRTMVADELEEVAERHRTVEALNETDPNEADTAIGDLALLVRMGVR